MLDMRRDVSPCAEDGYRCAEVMKVFVSDILSLWNCLWAGSKNGTTGTTI